VDKNGHPDAPEAAPDPADGDQRNRVGFAWLFLALLGYFALRGWLFAPSRLAFRARHLGFSWLRGWLSSAFCRASPLARRRTREADSPIHNSKQRAVFRTIIEQNQYTL
jgi:hypothetical protein